MAHVAGKFQLEKNENLVQYLKDLGLPEEKAAKADSLRPVLEVTVNGNRYILNSNSGLPNATITFALNEEFDDPMPTGDTLKSVAKLEGNKLTITSKTQDGRTGARVYDFSDKELVVSLTSSVSKVVAKRVYKRI